MAEKINLAGISSSAWEHPADRAALSALKQLRGLDELVKLFVSITSERAMRLVQLASSARVTPRQFAKVNAITDEVVSIFGWSPRPEVYVTQSPFFNAQVFGVREPFIIINSSILRSCPDEELAALLAHELGHIMSGHALYKSLTWMLANVSLSFIPMAGVLVYPIMAALAEWNRKSELSADRAGLLATQREEPNYNLLMRMAGGDDLSQMSMEDFFAQAKEFEERNDIVDSVHKIFSQIWLSHPFPVVRLQELKTWAVSGQYRDILGGSYARRGQSGQAPDEDIKRGYEYYKATMRDSNDPLSRLASNLGGGIESAVEDIGEKLKDLFDKL